jgi:hypothetical protein
LKSLKRLVLPVICNSVHDLYCYYSSCFHSSPSESAMIPQSLLPGFKFGSIESTAKPTVMLAVAVLVVSVANKPSGEGLPSQVPTRRGSGLSGE